MDIIYDEKIKDYIYTSSKPKWKVKNVVAKNDYTMIITFEDNIKNSPESISVVDQSVVNNKGVFPSEKLLNIASRLNEYSTTKPLSHQLNELLENSDTKKSEYFKFLSKFEGLKDQQEQKFADNDALIDLQKRIQNISSQKFNAKFKGFEHFYEDFPYLTLEFELLKKIRSLDEHVFSDSEQSELYSEYEILNSAFDEATKESISLKEEQDALTAEIEQFALTAAEYKQKYRLSIDWEGKKPFMVSLSKKLSEKRDILIEKETALSDELQILYEEYPMLHDSFCENFNYFSHSLDKIILSFEQSMLQIGDIKNLYFSLEGIVKNDL